MFQISKCRGEWLPGLCITSGIAKRMQLRSGSFRFKNVFGRRNSWQFVFCRRNSVKWNSRQFFFWTAWKSNRQMFVGSACFTLNTRKTIETVRISTQTALVSEPRYRNSDPVWYVFLDPVWYWLYFSIRLRAWRSLESCLENSPQRSMLKICIVSRQLSYWRYHCGINLLIMYGLVSCIVSLLGFNTLCHGHALNLNFLAWCTSYPTQWQKTREFQFQLPNAITTSFLQEWN